MRRCSELIGLPVLALGTGTELGRVRDLWLERRTGDVTGLLLEPGRERMVPLQSVASIGPDAVTVSSEAVVALANPAEEGYGLTEVRGRRVMTTTGRDLGAVEDWLVEVPEGKLAGVEVSGGIWQDLVRGRWTVPGAQVVALGEDALMVPPELAGEEAGE